MLAILVHFPFTGRARPGDNLKSSISGPKISVFCRFAAALLTLEDARRHILALPKSEHETVAWQIAIEALLLAAGDATGYGAGAPGAAKEYRKAAIGVRSDDGSKLAESGPRILIERRRAAGDQLGPPSRRYFLSPKTLCENFHESASGQTKTSTSNYSYP